MIFARMLLEADQATREQVAALLGILAKSPEESERIAGLIESMIERARARTPSDTVGTVDTPTSRDIPVSGAKKPSSSRNQPTSRQVTVNPLPAVKRKRS